MSDKVIDLVHNFEYIAEHHEIFIEDCKLFTVFGDEEIEKILKLTNLSPNEFISLIRHIPSTVNEDKAYIHLLNANVSLNNFKEAISILTVIKKKMKFQLFNNIIPILIEKYNKLIESTKTIDKLQSELNNEKIQNQKSRNQINSLITQINDKEALISKISQENNNFQSENNNLNNQNNNLRDENSSLAQNNREKLLLKRKKSKRGIIKLLNLHLTWINISIKSMN
ncbi:hypothetical protein TVAG_085800 [Trichomonas vaginalis G3]|uniref:Uncharacterized protein n=1 Tax=Trichomonas vaginalis (strain ATCC PRA-98 / G3) TaxID=412133 RepID=A2G5Q8_TRIV3|nr:protein ubiquitination [Trichomonas vaginalis G3]EAX87513.1 hypothetical protein TVAG_085800 [Trichomonas vaginalis G3]KAI5492030.1 protein ubiquitination [Trichomonas vaginalis G3]|eukprot:XP_001300443.1 hypothetical protein [Trichomonas vaginalis G3]